VEILDWGLWSGFWHDKEWKSLRAIRCNRQGRDPPIVPDVAVMVAAPCATAVATRVVLFTVATDVFDEAHVAVVVRFCVVPLL
jgi:hypothetical protein